MDDSGSDAPTHAYGRTSCARGFIGFECDNGDRAALEPGDVHAPTVWNDDSQRPRSSGDVDIDGCQVGLDLKEIEFQENAGRFTDKASPASDHAE